MSVVFGSADANEILKKDRAIAKRIANLHDEYDEALKSLEYAEKEFFDAESEYDDCRDYVSSIKKFATEHGVILD